MWDLLDHGVEPAAAGIVWVAAAVSVGTILLAVAGYAAWRRREARHLAGSDEGEPVK